MNKKNTIDGFTPRRKTARVLGGDNGVKTNKKPAAVRKVKAEKVEKKPDLDEELDIDNALEGINIDESPKIESESVMSGARRRRLEAKKSEGENVSKWLKNRFEKANARREKKGKKPLSLSRFVFLSRVKIGVLAALLLGLIVVGPMAYRFIANALGALGGVTNGGSIFDLTREDALKKDEQGRTNILLFGTSPEDWEGADMADSIILASLNEETGKVFTISLPRDLWVKHNCPYGFGTYAGKLNESYYCGKNSEGELTGNESGSELKRLEMLGHKELANSAGEVLGLDVHYTVRGNWQVLTDVVDAIGGIDVTIEVYDGSPAMYDVATGISYNDGETVHMDGQTALNFSRARGSMGGYGLSGSNFDRERNQQKVIKAIVEKINREKSDINKLSGILRALGDNISTSFESSEVRSVLKLVEKFNSDNIVSIPLVTDGEGQDVVETGEIEGASVVVPTAGTYDYTGIQKYVAKKMSGEVSTADAQDEEEVVEEAKIMVLNGTYISGLAGQTKAQLEGKGYVVLGAADSPEKGKTSNEIYYASKSVKKKAEEIADSLGGGSVKEITETFKSVADGANVVVVLGEE